LVLALIGWRRIKEFPWGASRDPAEALNYEVVKINAIFTLSKPTLLMNFKKNAIITLLLSTLFIAGCNRSTPAKLTKTNNEGFPKDNCLKTLSDFADTLKVDNVGLFAGSDKSKNDRLKDCDLKKYRKDFKMKSSIVLLVLKFYTYDLKQSWSHEKANDFANRSDLTAKIIFEYAYLYYGKEKYYAEDLNIEDIIYFIKKNAVFLKNPLIKKQYDDSYKVFIEKIKLQHRVTL
jgi:hypothetical protein